MMLLFQRRFVLLPLAGSFVSILAQNLNSISASPTGWTGLNNDHDITVARTMPAKTLLWYSRTRHGRNATVSWRVFDLELNTTVDFCFYHFSY
jgi:hypothetical protein